MPEKKLPIKYPIHGTRGDTFPPSEIVFRFEMDEVITAADWTALAQLRLSPSDASIAHTFVFTLRDSSDDVEISENELEVRLTQLTPAESTALVASKYVGDLQITRTSTGWTRTLVAFQVEVYEDVSR